MKGEQPAFHLSRFALPTPAFLAGRSSGLPTSTRRIRVLIAIMVCWSAAIGARLYFLHVVQSADYREMAARQHRHTLEITPRRGAIFDRNGNTLAISIKVDSVFAVPTEIKDPLRTARVLSGLTGVAAGELLDRFRSGRSFAWIKRKISAVEASAIARAKLPGIYFQKEDRRFYPKGEMAAHVLGYVTIDEEGAAGLEYRYNDQVRGEAGKVVIMKDARRTTYGRIEIQQPPQAGANLITTIDENIQYIVEKELAEAASRTHAAGIFMIVTDPRSGEILAMANHPGFNPNEHVKYSPASWINRAVSHTYEPGSTFKIVTAGSVLEENLATPDELIDCQLGSILLYGHRIHDHKPFGVLTVSQIMQYSSDVGAIKLGLRLGEGRFAGYIERFGFGRFTGIDLPGEERGQTKPAERWSKISIGAISMGQEVAVTPLQMVSLVSAVANGGILYRPYVVRRVQHPQQGILAEAEPRGERIMSETTARQLQNMLEVVVTDGTGKSSKLDGYRAAGKTGTAQKIDETGRYSRTKYVASFVGFAPVSNPAVAIIVVLDEPAGAHHGGDVAAPVFKKIAEQVLRYKTVVPDVPAYAPRYRVKPPKSDRKPEDAVRPAKSPDWKLVEAALTKVVAGKKTADVGEIVVPDFRGRSLRQATEESLELGLKPVSIGSGRAAAQYPSAGARVQTGTRVGVVFSAR